MVSEEFMYKFILKNINLLVYNDKTNSKKRNGSFEDVLSKF